jgi:transcription initiation factor TFIID subunit 3
MTPPTTLFHALLRPSILQILRAAGYHGARSAVVDILTDLAARYMSELCHMTAIYASHNGSEETPTVVDLRMALQHMGALLPEKPEMEQMYLGVEDTRGTDLFTSWFGGHESKEIKRVASEGDDEPFMDYLLG